MISRDVGAYIKGRLGLEPVTVMSDTTSDADVQYGAVIDRQSYPMFRSVKVVGVAALDPTSAKTATVTVGLQDAAATSAFTDYSTASVPSALSLGATSAGASTHYTGEVQGDYNIDGARRYIRMTMTGDLAATSSLDSLKMSGTLVFGGCQELPTT